MPPFAFQVKMPALKPHKVISTTTLPKRYRVRSPEIPQLLIFQPFFQLRLFTCAKKDDLRPVIKCFYNEMVKEGGIGMLMLLYSLLLSRGTDK